ncbi:MAG TPA: ligase-associated DNA damage response DEXH box helicase [Parafilimonas sp.]|nr:ligase-associated DNA damage response DEXH box helicase [Parafilimonas sp.]
MKLKTTKGYSIIQQWLASKNMQAFRFQEETWQHIINNKSGLVNAPTGCGKTFSVFLGSIIQFINEHPDNYQTKKNSGLQLLWITPLRALAKDITRAMQDVVNELGMEWDVAMRNGDTEVAERQRQTRNMPEVLIITPESLMLLLAQKNYPSFFKNLRIIAVDEWHELLGSKRGVQVELAISRLLNVNRESSNVNEKRSTVNRQLSTRKNDQQSINNSQSSTKKLITYNSSLITSLWGISATIGNLDEAKDVLLASLSSQQKQSAEIVKAKMDKRIEVLSIIPDEIEKYPWAGHLGIKLAEKIVPIIEQSNTTLVFINTRSMSELWYQTLLNIAPQFAGAIALHHGSIEHELRIWVEEALHAQKLKAVVCTASLDLGVDFRPVDTVIQVGSPKGVSRFLQRAGRSGHKPGDISKVYFLPTHSLELVEAAGLKNAINENVIESRPPMMLCFDVLMQYLCTLAIGEGFYEAQIFREIKSTFCYADITHDEWRELLQQITGGGRALENYDEYKKVEVDEHGLFRIKNRRIAMRHRMQIGTIVSDAMMKIKMMHGGYIGMIEEWFLSRLEPGDAFTFAGRNLELVMIKEMTAYVKNSPKKKSIIPSWMGARMSLTANLGMILRRTFNSAFTSNLMEMKALHPLFKLQEQLSHVPQSDELLIEQIEAREGFHLIVYPFEGRQIHEAMSSILAYRISQITPITFSIAMNDYGFELLSDQPIPVDDTNVRKLFTTENLIADIQRSVNSVEMAQRKFRDIAVIGGLIFTGYPGEPKKAKHLQASASLLFKVFSEYDPNNILLRQAYHEVFEQQMEEVRLRAALERISNNDIILKFPERLTPLSFPIIVDSLSRYNLSSEKFEDRVRKMQKQLEKE